MSSFEESILSKISANWYNDFGRDNYDELRFGPYVKPPSKKKGIKYFVKRLINYQPDFKKYRPFSSLLEKYGEGLNFLYGKLDIDGKKLLTDVIAFRILGNRKIKLPLNNAEYWNLIKRVDQAANKNDRIDPGFMHFELFKTNLSKFGIPIDFYFTPKGIVTDFFVEQYAYKENGLNVIQAEPGDIVLDLGGCWGDTALYFANKVGREGKVFSFEFIPNNIQIHNINTNSNPELKKVISLVEHPVSEDSDAMVYFKDNGPGSKVMLNPFPEQTGQVRTISIDDFVLKHGLTKVDFIKMDIEGSEFPSLRGAEETIRKFKPKLAISIYHSMDDFVNIPRWIADLNLGYELRLSHCTIFDEETVLFAHQG